MARVLVVDDDKGLRTLFGKRLQSVGHDVMYAANGQEGLNLAEREQPDLIVLDYQMPVMRGDEMMGMLRQKDWGKAIKVVFVSASASLDHLANLHEADKVLFKPITGHELTTTVKALLTAS
jgi:two-component system, OmpR family, alkaline phosphatase synthesis response regulator PhoP